MPRLKTSAASMRLAVTFTENKWLAKQVDFRTNKPPQYVVEGTSQKAALAVNLAEELLKMVPLDPQKIQDEWLLAWAKGDSKIDIELDGLLMDRMEALDPRIHVPTLKRLCDEQVFNRPLGKSKLEESSIVVDKFNLLLKQIEHDVQVFVTWQKKFANVEAAREHVQFKWKRDRRQQCLEAADCFLSSCARVLVWDKKVERNIAEVMNFKRQVIMAKLGLDSSQNIAQVVYLNATAPCLYAAVNQANGIEMLSWALSEQLQSVGLVMLPVFTYQRGKLVLEEKQILEQLCQGLHNLDWTFSLLFKEKTDARDQRPMSYQGRFVFPSPLELSKNCFWSSDLRKLQRTSDIPQLHSNKMREVENLDPDSVPDTSDQQNRVKGASKYAQLGPVACGEILDSVLNGSTYDTVGPAILIYDLHIGTGNMLEAFCNARTSRPYAFYIGFAEDQNEATYVEEFLKETLSEKFSSGAPLPNGEKLETTIPTDLLESLPAVPRLNVLVSWS